MGEVATINRAFFEGYLALLNAIAEKGGKPVRSARWYAGGTVSRCEVHPDKNGGCYLSLPSEAGQYCYVYDVEKAMEEKRYYLLKGSPIDKEDIEKSYLATKAVYVNLLADEVLHCKTGWWIDQYDDKGGDTLDITVDNGAGIMKCPMDEYGKTWVLLMNP